MTEFIEYQDFENPTEFVKALSPLADEWKLGHSVRSYGWIFRGQRNADWPLIPSAYREGTLESFDYVQLVKSKMQLVESQSKTEIDWDSGEVVTSNKIYYPINHWFSSRDMLSRELVKVFAELSDRSGLSVSGYDGTRSRWGAAGDKQHMNLNTKRFKGEKVCFDFPALEEREMFALSQHYGIPTNLLDWTESPYVAAYFAASDAMSHIKQNLHPTKETIPGSEKLCVWAVNPVFLEDDGKEDNPEIDRIQLFTASWQSNPNLRAQKGLFSVHKMNSVKYKKTNYRLEDVIIRIAERLPHHAPDKPAVRCFRTPLKGALVILLWLKRLGFSASTLYPGYIGVTKEIEETYNRERSLMQNLKMTFVK